jgi:anti-sigma B factor antagonist
MTPLATLDIEEGEITTARIDGEMDVSNVEDLGERILAALTNQARALVLDLRETSYLDSSGVHLILDTAAKLDRRNQQLHLLVEKESFVDEILETVSITKAVQVHSDPDEALRAIDRPPE